MDDASTKSSVPKPSFLKAMKKILILQMLLFVSSLIVLYQWPQPKLKWSEVEHMASEYMHLCSTSENQKNHNAIKSKPDTAVVQPLEGTVVVITGATSGIGQSLAKVIHKLGSTVVAIGRSHKKLSDLRDQLSGERIVTVLGDNADLESISGAADEIIAKFDRIDFLINNAGMHYHGMTNPLFWKQTKQGYDWLFVVNYLSHFLLTEKLLPLLEQSYHKPRIIQVSSSYHWKVDGSDLFASTTNISNNYNSNDPIASQFSIRTQAQCRRSYANSKFAQILHMRALSRRLIASSSNVKMLSICPSWVATHISDGQGMFQKLIYTFALHSDGAGIRSTLNAMFTPLATSTLDEQNDFISNTFHLYKQNVYTVLGLLSEKARDYGIRDMFTDFFFPSQIPFQKLMHQSITVETSAPETYDVTLQEALYLWSQNAVTKWA